MVTVQNFSHYMSLDTFLQMSRNPRTITSNKEVFKCFLSSEDRHQQQHLETTCSSTDSAVPEINRRWPYVLQRGINILWHLWHPVAIIVSVFKGLLHLWLLICFEPAGRDLTACWRNRWHVNYSDICEILSYPGLTRCGRCKSNAYVHCHKWQAKTFMFCNQMLNDSYALS